MANANCPQILPYTQEIGGKNRNRQWSSRGQRLYRKSICAPAWEAYRLPRPPKLVGRGSQPLTKTTPPRRFGPRLTISPSSPGKHPAGAHVSVHITVCVSSMLTNWRRHRRRAVSGAERDRGDPVDRQRSLPAGRVIRTSMQQSPGLEQDVSVCSRPKRHRLRLLPR